MIQCGLGPGTRLVIDSLAPATQGRRRPKNPGRRSPAPSRGSSSALRTSAPPSRPISRASVVEVFTLLEGPQMVAARVAAERATAPTRKGREPSARSTAPSSPDRRCTQQTSTPVSTSHQPARRHAAPPRDDAAGRRLLGWRPALLLPRCPRPPDASRAGRHRECSSKSRHATSRARADRPARSRRALAATSRISRIVRSRRAGAPRMSEARSVRVAALKGPPS